MATASPRRHPLTAKRIAAIRRQLLETDEEPLETPWHRDEINLLIDVLRWHWRGRTDFFVGGNMFIYYSLRQARERKYKGPDFFFVDRVDGTRKRLYWWVVDEDGRLPDLIVELSSPSTIKVDLTTKKRIYEMVFKTPEYYCYHPVKQSLLGWRLTRGKYQPIQPNQRGWLWSQQLQLWLGTWQGRYLEVEECWLRYYDKDGNLVPCKSEAMEQETSNLKNELLRLRAELAAKKNNGKRNDKSS
jgi:Uma2 family endonuclease